MNASLPFTWTFPLPRTHSGIPLGNGLMGALAWGERNVLRLTVGRSDFWDHRGGLVWTGEQSYSTIRSCLESGDEGRLRELFEHTGTGAGEPSRPSIMPFGRLELVFDPSCALLTGSVDPGKGAVAVTIGRGGERHTVELCMDMDQPLLLIGLPDGLPLLEVRRVTSWQYLSEYFRSIGIEEPEHFDTASGSGWVQTLPRDPALCLSFRQAGRDLFIATARGEEVGATAGARSDAREEATRILEEELDRGAATVRERSRSWWEAYAKEIPQVSIPNPVLQFQHDFGMYKFAGMSAPSGVAAGLQGPWIEEYKMPPWSADYHFNINVQMCYWPGYRGNRLSHFTPLWKLLSSWTGILRSNAEKFIGVSDGLLLPHAVDDRCTVMGGFWSGAIDHGCTAWVARMMYRHYQYTLDEAFLRDTAYPFMKGTMRVYEAMLERRDGAWVLPVSVSPEYRGNRMDAWGANASFQLAAIHRLIEDLIEASGRLGETPEPSWEEIHAHLPLASTAPWRGPETARLGGAEGRERILLWEGCPLEESHRHHSHLAGLFPFDVIDTGDPAWKPIIETSLAEWIFRGTGLWSGWCIPWAAILHSRLGNPETAEYLLETFHRFFTTDGYGTLHDATAPGFTLIGGLSAKPEKEAGMNERMQLDGGMGAATAVQEFLLQTRRGVHVLFAGAPSRWQDVSFRGMRTEGAFIVDAERKNGEVTFVRIHSPAGGTFRLESPWNPGTTITLETKPGETLTLPL